MISRVFSLWFSTASSIIDIIKGEHPHISGGIRLGYGKSGFSEYNNCNMSDLKQGKIERKLPLTVCIKSYSGYRFS